VSGVGPTDAGDSLNFIGGSDRSLIKLARRAPWALGPVAGLAAAVMKPFVGRLMASTIKALPEADRASLEDPRRVEGLKAATLEALRQGGRGLAWDEILFSRPWGFRLEDIKVPVLLWQGDEDTTVFPEMGRRMAAAIPSCSATFVAGAGHYLIVRHIIEIFSGLTAKR
jgi:pimeloyl-ACP methyl ester carboxylesterase